jgi:hypothetical protein
MAMTWASRILKKRTLYKTADETRLVQRPRAASERSTLMFCNPSPRNPALLDPTFLAWPSISSTQQPTSCDELRGSTLEAVPTKGTTPHVPPAVTGGLRVKVGTFHSYTPTPSTRAQIPGVLCNLVAPGKSALRHATCHVSAKSLSPEGDTAPLAGPQRHECVPH